MTFIDQPPTTRGFYAWKSTESSTQPIARYLCELQFYVGLRCAQSGMAPAQIGGLWCRLVPADEVEGWKETALRHCRNESYYRDLIIACGKAIGVEAYTTDAGETGPDVLCAKVPELVVGMITEQNKLRADAQRWRECAETAWGVIANVGAGNWSEQSVEWRDAVARWRWNYDQLLGPCHSLTPSSQPSPPTATASPAPETATASRLAEHESRLELLLRRTEFLLEQLSQALLDNGEFRIAWPADLAVIESTSTSQPTGKPSPSGDANCG